MNLNDISDISNFSLDKFSYNKTSIIHDSCIKFLYNDRINLPYDKFIHSNNRHHRIIDVSCLQKYTILDTLEKISILTRIRMGGIL